MRLRDLAESAGAFIGGLGFVYFAAAYVYALYFYNALSVSPEDAGLDQTATLRHGLLPLAAAAVTVTVVIYYALYLRILITRPRQSLGEALIWLRGWLRNSLLQMLLGLLGILAVLCPGMMLFIGATDGTTVKNSIYAKPPLARFYGLSFDPVEVRWLGKDGGPGTPVWDHPVLFLGKDAHMMLFYDDGRSTRIPNNKAYFSIVERPTQQSTEDAPTAGVESLRAIDATTSVTPALDQHVSEAAKLSFKVPKGAD